MFLRELSFQEKSMFLDLCIHVAQADNELAAAEKAMISEYCVEMQIPAIEVLETKPFRTVADYFSLADERVKKIVVLEILGLAYSDGKYVPEEVEMIKKFTDIIGFSEEDYNKILLAIEEYYQVCYKLAEVIQ